MCQAVTGTKSSSSIYSLEVRWFLWCVFESTLRFTLLLVVSLPVLVTSCLCIQDYDAFIMTPDGGGPCEITAASVVESSFVVVDLNLLWAHFTPPFLAGRMNFADIQRRCVRGNDGWRMQAAMCMRLLTLRISDFILNAATLWMARYSVIDLRSLNAVCSVVPVLTEGP